MHWIDRPTFTEKDARRMPCVGPENCGSTAAEQGSVAPRRLCVATECLAWRWRPDYPMGPTMGYCGVVREASL